MSQLKEDSCSCDANYSERATAVVDPHQDGVSVDNNTHTSDGYNGGTKGADCDSCCMYCLPSKQNLTTFSLENISSSSYYIELVNTAISRDITLFAVVCRHQIGERLACLKNRMTTLSEGDTAHYDVGRVLYLTMLWQEGMKYIENLTKEELKDEHHCLRTSSLFAHCPHSVPSTAPYRHHSDNDGDDHGFTRNQVLLWLKVISQGAVDHVVSNLTSSSLEVLNTLAGQDEAVVIDESITDQLTLS